MHKDKISQPNGRKSNNFEKFQNKIFWPAIIPIIWHIVMQISSSISTEKLYRKCKKVVQFIKVKRLGNFGCRENQSFTKWQKCSWNSNKYCFLIFNGKYLKMAISQPNYVFFYYRPFGWDMDVFWWEFSKFGEVHWKQPWYKVLFSKCVVQQREVSKKSLYQNCQN